MTLKNNTYRNGILTSIIATIIITSGIGLAYAQFDIPSIPINTEPILRDNTFGGTNTFGETTGVNANVASGEDSAAFGWGTTASGERSFASGSQTTASAVRSAAFGDGTLASFDNAVAFGRTNTASGAQAAVFGQGNLAATPNAVAFGLSTQATGNQAVVFGTSTIANAVNSAAFGYATIASGYYATGFGYESVAQPLSSFVVGQCNEVSGDSTTWIATDPLFVIGNGDSVGSGQPCDTNTNAVTVLKNGNVGIGTVNPNSSLEVAGIINSTSGGFAFPDGSTQTSSAPWITIPGGEIYYDAANVGIGNTNPNSDLDLTNPIIDAYIQLDTRAGAPDPVDCIVADLGRMIVDNTLPYLYVCQMAGNPAAPTWIIH